jgi:hypothetical protein
MSGHPECQFLTETMDIWIRDLAQQVVQLRSHRPAEVMSRYEANAGAIAFARRGDPNLGEFDDAVILKTFGDVPEDFRYA